MRPDGGRPLVSSVDEELVLDALCLVRGGRLGRIEGFRAGSGGSGFLLSSKTFRSVPLRNGFLLGMPPPSKSGFGGRAPDAPGGEGGGGGASLNGSELAGNERRLLERRGGEGGFGLAGRDGRRLCSGACAWARRGGAGGGVDAGSSESGSAVCQLDFK